MSQKLTFDEWLFITKTFLTLTEITEEELIIFMELFEHDFTPQLASQEYINRKEIK